MAYPKFTVAQKIARKSMLLDDGCVEWLGWRDKKGYGYFEHDGRRGVLVHRAIYIETHGPLDASTQVHHQCRNKSCVNVEHLVALTAAEHAAEHLHDECAHGHPFSPDNTYVYPDGTRRCMECHRQQQAARWRRKHPTINSTNATTGRSS